MATAVMSGGDVMVDKSAKEKRPRFKFRLLAGGHIDNDPDTGKERVFKANDVFESEQMLHMLNGGGQMSPKFELLTIDASPKEASPWERRPDETVGQYARRLAGLNKQVQEEARKEAEETVSKLDKMNEASLREFAAEEEIPLDGLTGKDAILKKIKMSI